MKSKQRSYIEVMKHIPDKATIGTTSFGIGGLPEQLVAGLGKYYKKYQHPKEITFCTTAGIGVGEGRGLDHLIESGLLKRVVASHIATSPLANQAAQANQFEMFQLPQGIIGKLYRNAAGKGPGVFSQVGIDTFIDPKHEGGKLNQKAQEAEALVSEVELNGERWLHYKPLPINVAFIKATYADEEGNLSIQHETHKLESLSLAMAAYNTGGVVIAQVEQIVEKHIFPPKDIFVPGLFVDYVVVAKEKYHMQTAGTYYNPALSNEIRIPLKPKLNMPLSPKKAMVRRVSQEIPKGSAVNLGNGIAAYVGEILAESKVIEDYYLNTDMGSIGGLPATGIDYAPNYNAEAVIHTEDMFNFYHGNGLDVAVLGFGQLNATGDMNSTKLGEYIFGPGGMIDISHGAKKIIFVGTFVVKGKTVIKNGQLIIEKEGIQPKFVKNLPFITFSAKYAREKDKEILVVTDRAVFDLTEQGQIRLIEIAPGLDLEEDILKWMEFKPIISESLKEMDLNLFKEDWILTR